jgi:hypothetical protein
MGRSFFTRSQDLFRYITIAWDEEHFLKQFEIVDDCPNTPAPLPDSKRKVVDHA